MEEGCFEIWRNERSQTWKVFANLTEELRVSLRNTGWSEVGRYQEADFTGQGACPEEILRQESGKNGEEKKGSKPSRTGSIK